MFNRLKNILWTSAFNDFEDITEALGERKQFTAKRPGVGAEKNGQPLPARKDALQL